jgi:hypothetical protein
MGTSAPVGHLSAALAPVVSVAPLLSAFGALGVLLVVFAESGLLLVGFFLPGDTLLLPAGVLCASGAAEERLVLWQVLLCAAVGAIAGAQAGFWFGRRGGRALLERPGMRRLRAGLGKAETLLVRHGAAWGGAGDRAGTIRARGPDGRESARRGDGDVRADLPAVAVGRLAALVAVNGAGRVPARGSGAGPGARSRPAHRRCPGVLAAAGRHGSGP